MYQQSPRMRIVKLLLHETGSYNNQYRRPYNTNLNGSAMNTMLERLQGVKHYDASMMGGIANQFISPVATPEKQIVMANGWGERRMRFMMEVEHTFHTGGNITEIILGYTDYNGVGLAGSIDPQMEFYINSTMHIRNTVEHTPMGNQLHQSITDSSHILIDNSWTGICSGAKDQRMRPEDVYATMGRSHLSDLDGTVLDTRSMSSNMATKSNRANGSAANYMAKILNGYEQATMSAEFGMGNAEILSKARGLTRESLATKDPFLHTLAQVRGSPVGNTFRFNDLKLIDMNVEHVTRAQLLAPTAMSTVHQVGLTADWGASDQVTSIATILSQSIPGLLMELALTRIIFKASNYDSSAAIQIMVVDAEGFGSGDYSRNLDVFRLRLEHEILRDVSYDNQVGFAIEMRVDLLGETWISLSWDNQSPIDYVTPSFADALLTPVITMDNTRAVTLASDFESLAASLFDTGTYNTVSGNKSGSWQPGII
ncbi:MAG: hypothetical protein ACD_84C00040G0001 [uncultured bacterium]|nr:MAG: hypothetical protein ACD_84C00040G0001 [uncultured bacterium]